MSPRMAGGWRAELLRGGAEELERRAERPRQRREARHVRSGQPRKRRRGHHDEEQRDHSRRGRGGAVAGWRVRADARHGARRSVMDWHEE